MPVTIGAKRENDFSDPIAMLSDCHRRIERFLDVLIAVAGEARGAPPAADQRMAFENALRYFRDAAPKHTADEEESLFPRLRRLGTPEAEALIARADSLREDHIRAEMSHQQVERLGQAWLADGRLAPEDAARLAELLAGLQDLYRQHIAVEERELFPAAARLLSAADCRAVGAEMAARRGVAISSAIPDVR